MTNDAAVVHLGQWPVGGKLIDRVEGPEDAAAWSRRFWLGFAGGWMLYLGLVVSLQAVAGGSGQLADAMRLALVSTVPAAAVSFVVALQRKRLLRPEWSVRRTIAVHGVVGLGYAVCVALLVELIVRVIGGPSELAEAGWPLTLAFRAASAVFLYGIFFGYLVWGESIRRVHESHQLAAREAVLRAEAEAKAIRAQFNPHFVFNTLHSLMLLVRDDPATAERAIEDVATLIRYASVLQRRDIDAVPLAKELEVARRYLALEQLRLQERLEVEWHVDERPEVTIPAFALQTLVENAIKHGIEPKPEGGRLTVRIERTTEPPLMRVVVIDDGVGANPTRLRAPDGHGLALLRARLDARYGGRGSLEWQTELGKGFAVEMRIPAEPAVALPALDVIEERVDDPSTAGT